MTDAATPIDAVLSTLVAPPDAVAPRDVDAWWADHRAATAGVERPVDRAMLGAARVERLGWAFAGAYQAALRALPGAGAWPADALASFAVTEPGGNHPRAIASTLRADAEGLRVDGTKSWVTLGPDAGVVLAIVQDARSGGDGEEARPTLRAVRVPVGTTGLVIEPRADPAPFVPEIPHATARLDAVRVPAEAVLPGDGWDDFAKPFRTLEDVHVLAATLAWLAALGARHGWDPADREAALAQALAARDLAMADPRSPATHVALAGLFAALDGLLDRLEPAWARVDAPTRDAWRRDRPLLAVAGRARAKRREAAWARLGG